MTMSRTAREHERTRVAHVAGVGRLAAVLLVAILLQTALAPHLRLLGAYPDFALIVVVCVALVKGSETGAVFGFLTGALSAIALMEPFGLSAFVFVLIGYLAGRYAETADLSAGFAPLLSVFVATFVAGVLLAMAQFLLAREVPLGFFFGRGLAPVTRSQHPAGRAHLPPGARLAQRGR